MKGFLHRHRSILGEAGWVIFGQAATALATLVGLRLITEFVPPAVYGTVALVLGVVALAQGLAVGPLMQAVLRFHPDVAAVGGAAELRRAANRALRRPLLLALTSLVVSAMVWVYFEPRQLWLAPFALALFLAETARSVEITFLNAARRQRAMALLVASDAWLRPVAAVFAVWLWGPHGAAVLGGYLVGAVVPLSVYWAAACLSRAAADGQAKAKSAVPELACRLKSYAWPLTALPLIAWVSGQADRYIIGAFAGVSAAGLYAALYGLASKPFLMISASVELVLRQPFYARVGAADHAGARRALGVWLGCVLTAAATIALAFLLFHAEIAEVLFAAAYRADSALMGWIAAGYVLLAAAQVLERVCYACHDTRGVLGVQLAGALLSIAIAAPLVWRYGIAGAAWAVPAYFGVQLLLTMVRARLAWQRSFGGLTVNHLTGARPAQQ